MRWKKTAFIIALSVVFSAQAQDNVMVDLSVLDGLSSSYIAPAEPMFPTLPQQKTNVVRKKQKSLITAEKPKQKKTKQAKKKDEPVVPMQAKEEIFSEEEKIVVVDVEPASPVIEEEKKPQLVEEKQEEKQIEEKQLEDSAEEEETGQVSQDADSIQVEEHPAEKTIEEQQPEVVETPAEQTDNVLEGTKDNEPEKKNKSNFVQKKLNSREIVFADGVSELTAEQISRIDEIVGRFSNSAGNKVAIYSYNVDDGIDTFKKKRVSLNRAIEIRSYLLRQGFKNFSIKVININSDSDKVNTVELEEI